MSLFINLLDILVCSIALYFHTLFVFLTRPKGERRLERKKEDWDYGSIKKCN